MHCEKYAGGELFNYIVENGRLPEAESRRFFQQMLYVATSPSPTTPQSGTQLNGSVIYF